MITLKNIMLDSLKTEVPHFRTNLFNYKQILLNMVTFKLTITESLIQAGNWKLDNCQ